MLIERVLRRSRGVGAALARHQRLSTNAGADSVPSSARAVIIGGGIIGNSIAYHLTRMGIQDVLLLEQHNLTAGTTWHAAGLMCTFGSMSETSTEIRKYSKKLYSELEAETGQSTGFKPIGFIELAAEPDRLEEYRRISAINRKFGVDVQEITPKEVEALFPLCRTDDILAGFYVPDDGRVNPIDASMALAKGARMKGAKICEGVRVVGISEDIVNGHRKVTGVMTEDGGHIQAEYVVNCAGMWARQLGEKCGVNIPNQAAEHYYIVTDEIEGVDPSWPIIEDTMSHTYIRPEGAGLMVGLFEPKAASWNVKSIPDSFAFGDITPDWERMGPYVETAMNRVPATLNAGIKTFFCGPESFTPDLAPIVGEAPEIRNYFVAAGMNSIGILSGGGIGRAVAHWIATGKPDVDITGMNIDRLHKYQANPQYRSERVVEMLGNVYKCHYPYKPVHSARGAKYTPFYDRAARKGARFRAVSGFETPDWYVHDASSADPSDSELESDTKGTLTWGRPGFFPYWEREHLAVREGVGLIDMSFMSKFLVQGRDAGTALNRLCTANVDGSSGEITYTQCLNADGMLEADVTVSKLEDGRFLVIATDTAHRHVEALLKRNLDPEASKHVFVTDVTGGYAQLNLQGPKSRAFMQALTDTDMSNEAFPFRSFKEVSIGLARCHVARITYVGELGYELHIPTEFAGHVYDCIDRVAADGSHELVHCGLKALNSLRLEKGYRDYGHDMDNLDSLLEVGLGFTADFDKPGGFVGDDCVLKQREQMRAKGGLPRRLVSIKLPSDSNVDAFLYHGEVVWRDGEIVGDVRGGAFGHTLGASVGLAMIEPSQKEGEVLVNKAYLGSGDWQVEIGERRVPCEVSLQPFYDPRNHRIKA